MAIKCVVTILFCYFQLGALTAYHMYICTINDSIAQMTSKYSYGSLEIFQKVKSSFMPFIAILLSYLPNVPKCMYVWYALANLQYARKQFVECQNEKFLRFRNSQMKSVLIKKHSFECKLSSPLVIQRLQVRYLLKLQHNEQFFKKCEYLRLQKDKTELICGFVFNECAHVWFV